MLDPADNKRLADRLEALRSQYGSAPIDAIRDVVGAVLSSMNGDLSATEATLLSEVEALGLTIQEAKREIAALRVDDLATAHIPEASDELEAIVESTANATNEILDTCEVIQEVAGKLDGDSKKRLEDATTRIFEACGFQDLTGQRISKVVRTLKTIEERVASIVDKFGDRARASSTDTGAPEAPAAPQGEAALLNGPALPGSGAVDQSEIDRLLASFD